MVALSPSQQRKLNEEFEALSELVIEEKKAVLFAYQYNIVKFCTDDGIELYNIFSLKQKKAQDLLSRLIDIISLPVEFARKYNAGEQLLLWKNDFEFELAQADYELRQVHHRAYLSVLDQWHKTGQVQPNTLLTQKDLQKLLFDAHFYSERLLLTSPFSLTSISNDQKEEIKELTFTNQDIFLPVHHDGHWFYLLRQNDKWSVNDSQPIVSNNLSPRQLSIFENSSNFLNEIHDSDYVELSYQTTAAQVKNYDCGTHVVNAYRSFVDDSYLEKNHQEIINELLNSNHQLIEEDEEQLEDITVPVKKIEAVIEATVSSQLSPEKETLYRKNLTTLVDHVVNQGLFNQVRNKIDLKEIDNAEAEHETDEEFAIRLQEAEFRKVGLKF